MTLLLDTHALLWWVTDDARLSSTARDRIAEEAEVFVSNASLWELAIKAGVGKITLEPSVGEWFEAHTTASRFGRLELDRAHLAAVEHLAQHHRDPFDRVLIAQARIEQLPLISADRAFASYDVDVIW